MSLDFAVLDAEGYVDQSVSVSPETHHEIMSIASENGFESILPFKDYYEDATFPIESTPSLAAQVEALRQIEGVSEEARDFLARLTDLIRYAMEQRKPIQALAD